MAALDSNIATIITDITDITDTIATMDIMGTVGGTPRITADLIVMRRDTITIRGIGVTEVIATGKSRMTQF
ncbi:MAG: hypothetical protein KC917_13950 [Candidatus Omnitrophica bacterium]|nr:hypothetical protein [Candidatus Omnitrophota bacterium]MCA9433635.1 hypothetical protein [Candidatus Omnitrophota bacterium]MCB9768714.1 hypothetical protein [Candidatus Omnitrophota bacterium]MCB9784053.1 hypothetical protein [Candidatus Omnitrophota bacterium]